MYNISIIIGVDNTIWSFATSGFSLLCCSYIEISEVMLVNKSLLSLICKRLENTVLSVSNQLLTISRILSECQQKKDTEFWQRYQLLITGVQLSPLQSTFAHIVGLHHVSDMKSVVQVRTLILGHSNIAMHFSALRKLVQFYRLILIFDRSIEKTKG